MQHVCWYEADAYARWAGRRLPTEAEWEKAASWDPATRTKRRYPWGDDAPTAEHANLGQRRYRPAAGRLLPGRRVAACGALQMVGDVWEWTSTRRSPATRASASFPYREYSEVFFGDDYKVLRGGSLGHRPAGLPHHVPQLGPPDPAADLRRLPHRQGRLMCRHLAYLGAARHARRRWCSTRRTRCCEQSYAPRAAAHGTVNADGFGAGLVRRRRPTPVALPPGPADLDRRVVRLPGADGRRRVRRSAAVRSATAGFAADESARRAVHRTAAGCSATTARLHDWPTRPQGAGAAGRRRPRRVARAVDSALLFGLPRHRWQAGAPLADGLADAVARWRWPHGGGRLNLLATDGTAIAGHVVGEPLYAARAPSGGVVIASEPYDDDPGWRECPTADRPVDADRRRR